MQSRAPGSAYRPQDDARTHAHGLQGCAVAPTPTPVQKTSALNAVLYTYRSSWLCCETNIEHAATAPFRTSQAVTPTRSTNTFAYFLFFPSSLNTYWFSKMVSAAHKVVVKGKKGGEVGSHKDE